MTAYSDVAWRPCMGGKAYSILYFWVPRTARHHLRTIPRSWQKDFSMAECKQTFFTYLASFSGFGLLNHIFLLALFALCLKYSSVRPDTRHKVCLAVQSHQTLRFLFHWIQSVGNSIIPLFPKNTILHFCSEIKQPLKKKRKKEKDFRLVVKTLTTWVFFCVPQCPHSVTLPQGLTWAGVVFSCVGGCVRGGSGGHPLVWTHVILAQRRAGLSRLLVCQVQRGAFLGGRQWSSWPGCGVHLQPGLDFVLHNLSVVSSCHPALVQSFVVLADSGDLQLVWDVVALDFHCLLEWWKETTVSQQWTIWWNTTRFHDTLNPDMLHGRYTETFER